MVPLAYNNFSKNHLVIVDDYNDISKNKEIDAALWTQEHTEAWVSVHPGYVSVLPKGLKNASPFPMAFMVNKKAVEWLSFLNYWLKIQKETGFQKTIYKHWIESELNQDNTPRWKVMKNILG